MKKYLLGLGMVFVLVSLSSYAMQGSDDEATLDAEYDSDINEAPFAQTDENYSHNQLEQIVRQIREELEFISGLILANKMSEANNKLQNAWLRQQVSNNPAFMNRYKKLRLKVEGPVYGPVTATTARIQRQLF